MILMSWSQVPRFRVNFEALVGLPGLRLRPGDAAGRFAAGAAGEAGRSYVTSWRPWLH